jgi:hypothetical protein
VATSIRQIRPHLVQTSADFSTWTTQGMLHALNCSEGAGQVVGDCRIVRYLGTIREPGATGNPTSATPVDLLGKWVRILIEDGAGPITVNTVRYSALWHGILESDHRNDQGGGVGSQGLYGSGLITSLARGRLGHGWVEARGASSTVADFIFRVPAFNTPNVGGRSSSTYSIDGKTVYVFNQGNGQQWTAKQILDNLLASHARIYVPGSGAFAGGITWALSAGTLLDYTPDAVDFNGMTLLDAVNALINPVRGLTYRVTVSGTTATITVLSTAASAITVTSDGGNYTLAAATDTATPDLTGIFIGDVAMTEDQSATYDLIYVIGARPWVACTLAYDPSNGTTEAKSLEAAWGSTEETTWSNGAAPDSTTTAVWRAFKVPATWDGRNYGGSTYGIRQSLELVSLDLTGSRFYDSTIDFPPSVMELTIDLPSSPGATPTNPSGARVGAKIFYKPSGASTWRTCTDASSYEPTPHLPRKLEVWQSPLNLSLGDTGRDQTDNKAAFEGGIVLATVGVREPDPLVMSWQRATVNWPRTTPRVLYYQAPNCEQWAILSGTVTGIDGAGALITQADATNTDASEKETFIRDDRPAMRSIMAFLIAYFSEPARALSWTDRSQVEYAYGSGAAAPGTLVTSATLGTGSTTINAVVTRRAWDLTEGGYGTSYTTERTVPSIEAIK